MSGTATIAHCNDAYSTIETQTNELITCNEDLERLTPTLSDEHALKSSEQELLHISRQCQTAAKALREETRKLHVPSAGRGRKRQVFAVTVKTVFGSPQITRLENDINGYRDVLQTRILTNLRAQSVIDSAQIDHIRSLVEKNAGVLEDLKSASAHLLSATNAQSSETRAHITEEANRISKQLTERSQQDDVLKGIFFPEMHVRREEIDEAHRKTFRWVLIDYTGGKPAPFSPFRHWLEHGTGIYWVSGKPGAGKSTLMRFILEHVRTRAALQKWAGRQCLMLSFFIWKFGSAKLQKSIVGFLRALLYQIVKAVPELTSLLTQVAHTSGAEQSSVWTFHKARRQLIDALTHLVDRMHCCIFVDGLDELDEGFQSMVELLQDISTIKNIKLCVSSRPEAEFYSAFAACPSLSLQELTKQDIRELIFDTLEALKWNCKNGALQGTQLTLLAENFLDKASGVFLWVKLALSSVRQGIIYDEEFDQLKLRLEELPKELEDLFAHIIKRIPNNYMAEAARYIKLLLANREAHTPAPPWALSTVTIALTNMDMTREYQDKVLEPTEIVRRCQIAEKRVLLRTAGLLELGNSAQPRAETSKEMMEIYDRSRKPLRTPLRFIHRTAEEFVLSGTHSFDLRVGPDDPWNAAQELAKSQVSRMKHENIFNLGKDRLDELRLAFRFLRLADTQTGRAQGQILHDLIRVSTDVLSDRQSVANGNNGLPSWFMYLGHRDIFPDSEADDVNLFDDEELPAPAFNIFYAAEDLPGICAAFGLEHSVADYIAHSPRRSTYLLQCAMETSHLRGYESTLRISGNDFRPFHEGWALISMLMGAGANPNAAFRISLYWCEARRFRRGTTDDRINSRGWRARYWHDGRFEAQEIPQDLVLTVTAWQRFLILLISRFDTLSSQDMRCKQRELSELRSYIRGFLEYGADATTSMLQSYKFDVPPFHQKLVHHTKLGTLEVEAEVSVWSLIRLSLDPSTLRQELLDLIASYGGERGIHTQRIACWFGTMDEGGRAESDKQATVRLQLSSPEVEYCLSCIYRSTWWNKRIRPQRYIHRSDKLCEQTRRFIDFLHVKLEAAVPALVAERSTEAECKSRLADGTWPSLFTETVDVVV